MKRDKLQFYKNTTVFFAILSISLMVFCTTTLVQTSNKAIEYAGTTRVFKFSNMKSLAKFYAKHQMGIGDDEYCDYEKLSYTLYDKNNVYKINGNYEYNYIIILPVNGGENNVVN